jgi:hypothetical protein
MTREPAPLHVSASHGAGGEPRQASGDHRRLRARRVLSRGVAAAALLLSVTALPAGASSRTPGEAGAAPFAFEPITFKRIPLPPGLAAAPPVFTADGKHLLFGAAKQGTTTADQLWITGLRGEDMHCITCSGGPPVSPAGIINPFPDGKRIFVGFSGVVECAPSVLDCRTHAFLPYDLSGAKPPGGIIPPGGAANTPQSVVSQGASPKLSPDGVHIGYSDVRSDGYEQLVVARLVRQTDKYVAVDPKVINPPGPTSATDPAVGGWSESTALYEFKTFTHGGASATYVKVGGADAENPDVWEVNLKTGQRTRLTAHPDWDEDMAISPDGRTMSLWSNRTVHWWDWLGGLMPYRSFIDAPMVGAEAGMLVNTPNNQACSGPMWLLPADGDRGGRLAGQPIVDYTDPDVHVADHVAGWPMWNRQGTMLALNTNIEGAGLFSGRTPPFLLVAQLTARRPAAPEPVVNSDVGSWAPAPAGWHPAFGFNGDVTLHGGGGGTATVHYGGAPGVLHGRFSETYSNYSEDGKTFLSGTKTIEVNGYGVDNVHEVAHLTMTGAHSGSQDVDLTIKGGDPSGVPTYQGSATVTYDGTTLSGPPGVLQQKGSCPERLPKLPRLTATATGLGHDRYAIKVTASIAGVGQNEAAVDTEPVKHALVVTGGAGSYTNDRGFVIIKVRGNHHRPVTIKVSAGETLLPTTLTIPAGT